MLQNLPLKNKRINLRSYKNNETLLNNGEEEKRIIKNIWNWFNIQELKFCFYVFIRYLKFIKFHGSNWLNEPYSIFIKVFIEIFLIEIWRGRTEKSKIISRNSTIRRDVIRRLWCKIESIIVIWNRIIKKNEYKKGERNNLRLNN